MKIIFLFLAFCFCSVPLKYAQAQLLTGFDDYPAPSQTESSRDVQILSDQFQKLLQAEKPIVSNQVVASKSKSETGLMTFYQNAPTKVFDDKSAKGITEDVSGGSEASLFEDRFKPTTSSNDVPPVDLQADKITRDEDTGIVVASGDVVIFYQDRILRANSVSYDVENDIITAEGYVVLNEPNGDIHTADKVELQDGLRNGFVEELKTYLADGAKFTASNGRRENGEKIIMKDAIYSPCEICKENPDKDLVWQLRASEVIYHEDENRISYDDARFEFFGVPIAYSPYFSHPDGTVKRKSGFLSPTLGYKSSLGAFAGTEYYWDIAPDRDYTAGLIAYTDEAPLFTSEWRQRWDDAGLQWNAGLTYSGRTDSIAGADVEIDEELRGYLFGEGLWDINDKWRSGFKVEYASDDQFLRQYDVYDEDVLENELYTERFSGRDYAVARLLTFQDVRVNEEIAEDQPEVLPEMIVSFVGDPNGVPIIGGRWYLGASFLGLRREGDGQDVNRASFDVGWQKRLIADSGLVINLDSSLRGDFYNIRDRNVAQTGSGRSGSGFESRFFPKINTEISYPVARPFERFQAVVEPVVSITASTDVDNNDEIPNEDSRDVQIDTKNLFNAGRFPGLDRVEDKSRVTYGLRTGVYGYEGSSMDLFLGQSYRFDNSGNPFPVGSGLSMRESDVVGEVNAVYQNDYNLNYRFQLAGDELTSERHELDASANFGRMQLSSQYLFAKALSGTDIDESREQVSADIGYYFTPEWRGLTGVIQDLGSEPGLRQAYWGVEYFGQCLSWALSAERSLTEDTSGDSGTEVLFRIGLKNLSQFEQSTYAGRSKNRSARKLP